jgi:hypothetical protein
VGTLVVDDVRAGNWRRHAHTILNAVGRRKFGNKLAKRPASSCPLPHAPPLDRVRRRGLRFDDGQQQRFPPRKSIAFLGSVPALIINPVQPR